MSTPESPPLLTVRQREVLAVIQELTDGAGFPPTLREIGDALGLASPSTVLHHVRVLEDVGLVSRAHGRPRARVVLPAEGGPPTVDSSTFPDVPQQYITA